MCIEATWPESSLRGPEIHRNNSVLLAPKCRFLVVAFFLVVRYASRERGCRNEKRKRHQPQALATYKRVYDYEYAS